MTKTIAIASLLAAALVAPPRALAAPSPYVPGEVLVKFKADATGQHRMAAVAAQAHLAVADLHAGWTHIRVRPGQTVEEAIADYAANPAVEYAQPNFIYRLAVAVAPNDPQYGQQWGLRNTGQTSTSVLQPGAFRYTTDNPGVPGDDIDIEPAWGVTTDCSGAVVAVVDTGVNYKHQDLAPNMWDGSPAFPNHGYDYADADNDPMDLNGHGTHVAGIIGAVGNNATGTTGVCWNASIMAVRVLDATGQGTTAMIVQGVQFAVSQGAKVINMSLGGGSYDQIFNDNIGFAASSGVLVVVAAGNGNASGVGQDNDQTPVYPCNFAQPNLICVAALDQAYELATFSNYGAVNVDVGAPGTNILSTWAGTDTVIAEALTGTGWSRSSTTSGTGGGWGFFVNGGRNFIGDPSSYPTGKYNANTDDRAYKSFALAGVDVAVAQFGAAVDVLAGDHLRIACRGAGGDPFAGGTILDDVSGVATFPLILGAAYEIPPSCRTATATFGFQLQSAPGSATARGVGITGFSITTLAFNGVSYNTENGTSMATPAVAGLATMLRAYNPLYTPADVVSAITHGGRPVASLAGKTTSGNAIDAMGSLAYINPPTGLTYVVH